jgi:AAA15 family ATPase/GTPase
MCEEGGTMADTFITNIQIGKVRHLENLTIALSDTERKHLILTGKNGSGKTSVLEAMRDWIVDEQKEAKEPVTLITADSPQPPPKPKTVEVKFNNYKWQDIPFYYFAADHKLKINKPTAIEKVELKTSDDIVKYMVFLDYQQMHAEKAGNQKEKLRIDRRFASLCKMLQIVFECSTLELKSVAEDLNFKIKVPNRNLFGFDEMSDGYSAALRIILDLDSSMESPNSNFSHDMPGIVLIDEIETHLHVYLQKKIMPYLIEFFPNIQFIVTTHSPFVLSSIENAVICDLENKTVAENFSAYSYSILVENYFDVDKYSTVIKTKIAEFERLLEKQNRNDDETLELKRLNEYLTNLPQGMLDVELALKLQSLQLNHPELKQELAK